MDPKSLAPRAVGSVDRKRPAAPLLIVDYSGKQEDSHGDDLNALLILRRIVTDRGGEMCLCGLSSDLLEKSRLGGFFPFAKSPHEAVERLLPVRAS